MNLPATTTCTGLAAKRQPVRNYRLPPGALEDAMIARMKAIGFVAGNNVDHHEPKPFEARKIPEGSVGVNASLKVAYDAVANGANTAAKVARALGIEKDHTYKSLSALVNLGLVTVRESRPTLYEPADPDLVVVVKKTEKELRFEAILSFLATPKTPHDIEQFTGASRATINGNITELLASGLILQLETLSRGRRQFIRA